MRILTSQHLARMYDIYSETEVTFSGQIIIASGLVTSDVYLRVADEHLHSVLYACSMKGARIVTEIGRKAAESLTRSNHLASLRMGFRPQDESKPLTFFVPARVESLAEYNQQKPNMRFVTLVFTQKPPDALIGILGTLLEINANEKRRREERIVLTPESMKRIGLESKESCVAIEGSSHRCILRDLSFSGAKVLTSATGAAHEAGKVLLKLTRCDLNDGTVLDGNIVRVEDVAGRSDLVALSIQYSAEPPISYKQRINSFFEAGAR